MKSLNLKLLILLIAFTITTSGCSIWDPIFRPHHEGKHRGDQGRNGDHDRDHKGDHDRHDDH